MLTAVGQFDVYHHCRSTLTQIDEDVVWFDVFVENAVSL
jgi:hypothetical protein